MCQFSLLITYCKLVSVVPDGAGIFVKGYCSVHGHLVQNPDMSVSTTSGSMPNRFDCRACRDRKENLAEVGCIVGHQFVNLCLFGNAGILGSKSSTLIFLEGITTPNIGLSQNSSVIEVGVSCAWLKAVFLVSQLYLV